MLDMKDKQDFMKIYRSYLEATMTFSLAALPSNKMPIFELDLDEGCWTNHDILHIGIGDADVDTEEDLMIWTLFRLGHECQHVLSTTNKSWSFGLDEGYHIICRALSKKIDKIPRLFRKDSDYDVLLDDAKKVGYNIKKNSIYEFVHFVINSLEDGRIERIRSLRKPGFKNYMIICRGNDWKKSELSSDLIDNIDEPVAYLYIILNQILDLSTMGIYQKGFSSVASTNKTIHKLVLKSIPYIKEAVKAPTCRQCMAQALKIIEVLADEIIEASRKSQLEELLEKLIESVMDKISADMKDYSFSDSRTEDTGDDLVGTEFSPFGSDMDENADELDSNESNNNSGFINDEKSTDSCNSDGNTSDMNTSGKNSISDDSTTNDSNKSDSMNSASNSSIADKISKAINDAADTIGNKISDTIEVAKTNSFDELENSIKAGALDKKKIPKEPVSGDGRDKPVTDIKDINGEYNYNVTFIEEARKYVPDKAMPAELNGMAKTLKRKIDKIFRNQESPLIRGQKAGTLDIANLYKLPMGQIDLFQKKAEDNEFDGCCYFLMDNSGSMGDGINSKRYYCCRALSILEEAFQNIMPLKIVAFDAYGSTKVHHEVIKNWSEKVALNGSYNYLEHESSGWGNKDGYSIRVATKELLQRPEDKKILVILSDGLPSDYEYNESGESDVYDAVKRARSQGIEVIGIYFGDNLRETSADVITFREMYDTPGEGVQGRCNSIITQPDKINDELVRILKRFCFR